jgi:hypothetical protein
MQCNANRASLAKMSREESLSYMYSHIYMYRYYEYEFSKLDPGWLSSGLHFTRSEYTNLVSRVLISKWSPETESAPNVAVADRGSWGQMQKTRPSFNVVCQAILQIPSIVVPGRQGIVVVQRQLIPIPHRRPSFADASATGGWLHLLSGE